MSSRVLFVANLLISSALFLISCAPKLSSVLLDTNETSPVRLLGLLDDQSKKIESLVGKGQVTFESPEMAGSATFDAAIKMPDSLLVKLEGPFGIDVGTLFLSRQKYIMYNSLENSVVTGTPTTEAIRSFIPFNLTFEQLLSTFSGVSSVHDDPADLIEYKIVDDMFFLSFRCNGNRCAYWVDPDYLLVAKYQVTNASGGIVLDANASWFAEVNGAHVAKRMTVKFPIENRRLAISYSSIQINGAKPKFDFFIPPNAKTTSR